MSTTTPEAGSTGRRSSGRPEEPRMLAGRYRVEQLIGRGGMAEVHMGFDTRLGRRVAIKLLRSSLANDPTFRIRFRQEAQAASRMTHPTIVRVFDAGEETVLETGGGEAKLPFIVMELVDGKLLKDLIKDGPMTVAEAGHIVTGILTALEYSHRAGVVHRDIKPGNVMITHTGQVKVMDFGIARAISDSSATVAQTTAILGTAQYFSPEQAKGETVDSRSDLYSTGIVLFEMLTGQAPFQGDTPLAVAYQHVSEVPRLPSELNDRLAEWVDAVVLRALEKDRDDRYATAAEFREDVEAVMAGRAPAARLPRTDPGADLFGGAAATPEAAMRAMAFDDATRVRTSTRPPAGWIWAGVACVAVVVLAVGIWVLGLVTGGFGADARTVPDLVGSTRTSATSALEHLQLRPLVHRVADDTVQAGNVLKMQPGGGTVLQKNSAVNIWVSTGPHQVTVPKLSGLSARKATAAILRAGLSKGAVTTKDSPEAGTDVVYGQDPAPGATVAKGTTIDLTIASGQVTLPDLTNRTVLDATSELTGLHLQSKVEPAFDCGPASDRVLGQDRAPGAIDQGVTVTLRQCAGAGVPTPTPTLQPPG